MTRKEKRIITPDTVIRILLTKKPLNIGVIKYYGNYNNTHLAFIISNIIAKRVFCVLIDK